MRIGSNIRRIRRFKNMSLQELADKANRSPQTLSLIERNLQLPKIKDVMTIAEALHVSLEEVIGFEEYKVLVNSEYVPKVDLGVYTDEELIREIAWRQRMRDMGVTMENQIARRRKVNAER